MAKVTKEDVIEFISNMTVLEMSQFVKELEEKFGVTAAAPVAVAAPGAAETAAAEKEEAKTEFDVVLTSFGDKKIQVIKEVSKIMGVGLKDAKAIVEGVPKVLKEKLPMEEAEKIKAQLEEVGASVEIK